MSSSSTPDSIPASPSPASQKEANPEADPGQTPAPIGELVMLPDFPQCILGRAVEIRGQVGIVVGIRNNSIKLRSPDGGTQSFNALRLRTLYAPMVRAELGPARSDSARVGPGPQPEEEAVASPPPARERIEEPDFSAPVRAIAELARQPDFPRCALGQHVDIDGIQGVVVEIVKGSLKVRLPEGTSRSYNAMILQKLHGRP